MMSGGDTIAAVSTPHGVGGIAVIRVSGEDATTICDKVWRGKQLSDCESHTVHLGEIVYHDGEMLDNAVATVFRAPGSFTGENVVELSVHGSPWIQQEVINLLVDAGARVANAGEFTRRAFVNGKLDLAQAEGVADMIAASSRAAQRLASRQMKGDFSRRLGSIRDEMVTLASLLELELDFSEEDVEFADRDHLRRLCDNVRQQIDRLAGTFRAGHALKEGVSVVIAGAPNVGKSTLLNRLLGEEKAIVSDIAGTTRDIIEDTIPIDDVLFRLIDTAGLRQSGDTIEQIGIERALSNLAKADIILCMIDSNEDIARQVKYLNTVLSDYGVSNNKDKGRRSDGDTSPAQPDILWIINKADISSDDHLSEQKEIVQSLSHAVPKAIITLSAKEGSGIKDLTDSMTERARHGLDLQSELIVTNARHYDSLVKTRAAIDRFTAAMQSGLSTDLLTQDLREAIHHLGQITGAITTDTLLQTIFSRFCIGK
ncbi:MAG: tRNA uridine-5-carboxymethylaminomethyl(34) synthesis GTPase MnmE [Muribaculaceae bacterium]|nr:tRNA uridine-5-carboxymethylaminomethyl(34) synthesis GTPase MnmE [Muribaculaceae bacterium]